MVTKPAFRLFRPWLLCLVLAALLMPFPAQTGRAAPQGGGIPPGHSDRILRLKFVEGTPTDNLQSLLPAEAWQVTQKIDPLFTLPKTKLKELKDKGNERLKKEKGDAAPALPDLGLWYEVLLVQGSDPVAAIALFQALPCVEQVGPAPEPTEPPQASSTPLFTSEQGYLGAAPGGLDAQYAWTIPGGTGAGITIYDIEYAWNRNHEDLSKIRNAEYLLNPGDTIGSTGRSSDTEHGTAVLGEMIADQNSFGVTGMAYGADARLVPSLTANLGWNVANAILLAVADGLPGDVILIEQQAAVCNLSSYGPTEWSNDVYQAILTASANGLVVVEPAGNGGVDLDVAYNTDQTDRCGDRFNRSARDSGAILVGAGRHPASGYDRQRYNTSSYGSRVDVQAWGSGVVTAGYGYRYGFPTPGVNSYYYATFNSTSSASAMIAASAAILQAIAIQQNGAPLSPWQVRDLLVQTGSPQLGDTAQEIGPRPDLRQAIANLPQSAETLTVNVGGSQNDGVCSVTNCSLSEAIVAANADQTPNIIGLASGATYTLNVVNNTDPAYGANGLPPITSPVILRGNGAILERSSAAGTPDFRLFQVSSGGTLTLRQATLRNGRLTGKDGGAVLNLGTATIDSSTLSGNSARNGGALANAGTLNLVSSTLYSNTAATNGGAISDSGTLLVFSSTLAGNSAPTGANLSTTSSTAELKNTLLVKGASGANCNGTLATGSAGNQADDSSCGASAASKTTAQINLAASLANNGGPTYTLALQAGSAAIDEGNTSACKASKVKDADQRGYNRFADGNGDNTAVCDIGAYEYNSSELPPPTAGDEMPPLGFVQLSPQIPDGANGWYRSPVILQPAAIDDTLVIELRCSLDPPVPPASFADLPEEICPFLEGAPVSADGLHAFYAAAMDFSGNMSEIVSASFQLDLTPPVFEACPAAGPFLLHSGDQAVGPIGVDASVSGLDEALSTLSGIVTTEAIGTQTLTFTAFDLAGNQSSQECSDNVIYDFGGYYPPVEPAPALNAATPGSAIPLKFSLAGDQGLDILAAGFPIAQQVTCDTLEPIGDLVATRPAGQSGLSYDPETGWYNYVWKTNKNWAGTCQVLTIQLIDGTQHAAYFQFQ